MRPILQIKSTINMPWLEEASTFRHEQLSSGSALQFW